MKNLISFYDGENIIAELSQIVDSGTTINIQDKQKAGYTFIGWRLNSGSDILTIGSSYTVNSNVDFHGVWLETVGEWLIIRTAEQLNNIRHNLSGNYILMSDISLVDFGNWEPIGYLYNPFKGQFNGNGFVIAGLTINRPTEDSIGLFGQVSGVDISNLGLVDVNIIGKEYVGSIVGTTISRSTISNSYCTGNIIGEQMVGGIAGTIWPGVISNTYSMSNVAGKEDVGGIAGGANGATISNSYCTGNITGEQYVGGIVGNAAVTGKTTILNSYSTGNITGDENVGGITGKAENSKILNSLYTGNIIGNTSVGGIVGDLRGSTISNSYCTGSTIGKQDVGGIAGYAGDVHDGDNSKILNSYNMSNVTGEQKVGGIVGWLFNSSISSTYCTGNVTGNTSVGGIAGDVGWLSPSNNFVWDRAVIIGDSAGYNGISKTDAELRSLISITNGSLGWKFGEDDDNPWRWSDEYSYPVLYWQQKIG